MYWNSEFRAYALIRQVIIQEHNIKWAIIEQYRMGNHINKEHNIEWAIITSVPTYNNIKKRCNLCLEEKLHILRTKDMTLQNKKSDIVSKCRHENKYYLMNTEMTPGELSHYSHLPLTIVLLSPCRTPDI